MTDASPVPLLNPRAKRWLEGVLLGLMLLGHAVMLRAYFVPLAGGVDPNGYHVGARLLADHGRYYLQTEDSLQFVGRMWVVNERGEYYPKYPPYYPVLAAGAMRMWGEEAGFWVNPVLAWLTLPGLYLWVRRRSGRAGALLAVFALATNPLFNFYALRQVSHASNLCLLMWSVTLLSYAKTASTARMAAGLGVLAGILAGALTGIRYTEFLMAAPVLWMALTAPRERRLLLTASVMAGLSLPWLRLAVFHQEAFGAPWRTGYSLTGEQTGFAWSYAADNFRFYFSELLATGLGPAVGGFALLGLAVRLRRQPADGLFFLLWLVPTALLYIFYYWAPEGRSAGYLRFLLTLWPAAIALAAGFVADLPRRFADLGRARYALPLVWLIAQGIWGLPETLRLLEPAWVNANIERETLEFVRGEVTHGSVLFGPQNLLNSLDFDQRYRLYADEILHRGRLQRLAQTTLQPGPSGLQKKRAESLQTELLDVHPTAYRSRILELISSHQAAGREVWLFAGTVEADAFRAFWRESLVLEHAGEFNPEFPAWRWIAAGKPREAGARPEPTVRRRPLHLYHLRLPAEK